MFTISTLCDDSFKTKIVCAYELDDVYIRFDDDRCDEDFMDELRRRGVDIRMDEDGNMVADPRYHALFEVIFSTYPHILNDEEMMEAAASAEPYRDSLPPPQHVA